MFIPDPGSWFLPVPDPGSKNSSKREGRTKFDVKPFFCGHKFHKIEIYFISEMLENKNWANFQRIIELFTQKIVTKLSKIWVWDPGSEIRKNPTPDPVSRGSKRGTPTKRQVSKRQVSKNVWFQTSCIGSRFNRVCGSGSGFGIRIRIQEGKNDPQK